MEHLGPRGCKNLLGSVLAMLTLSATLVAVVALPSAETTASASTCSTGLTSESILSPTAETKNLYSNLASLCGGSGGKMLWGVQDNPNLTSDNTDDDVDALVGEYPGLVEATYTDNTVCGSAGGSTLTNFTTEIEDQYNRGGVAGVHWLPEDPVTCDPETNDKRLGAREDICDKILPGYSTSNTTDENRFHAELDDLISALNGLVGDDGNAIPVLLRIFHEMTGSEHWWGGRHCSGPQFKQLWRYTIQYMAGNEVPLGPLGLSAVDNAILVWAPSGISHGSTESPSAFESAISKYYPGSAYVDVVGVDAYDKTAAGTFIDEPMSDATGVLNALKGIVLFAGKEGKFPAMTEGENDLQGSIDCGGSPCYWTDYVTDFQTSFKKLASIRYAMVWNGSFAPSPGDSGDFVSMFDSSLGSYLIMADNPSYPWYCPVFTC